MQITTNPVKYKNRSIYWPLAVVLASLLLCACTEDQAMVVEDMQHAVGELMDADGNAYTTVQIGEQLWMAENLRTTSFNDGSPIPTGLSNMEWLRASSPAFAWYNDDIRNKMHYGALYNWHAVNSPKGLCPPGWRVPSDKDFEALVAFVVSQGYPNEDIATGAGNLPCQLSSCEHQCAAMASSLLQPTGR